MKRLFLLLAFTATLALPTLAAPKKPAAATPAAEKAAPDFTGRYETAAEKKTVFILHVRQNGNDAEVEFSASNADGSGAAPDGNGSGSLNKMGELAFIFEDSLGNKGEGILKKTGGTFQLTMKALGIVEPRAAKFYGVIVLKRGVDRQQ